MDLRNPLRLLCKLIYQLYPLMRAYKTSACSYFFSDADLFSVGDLSSDADFFSNGNIFSDAIIFIRCRYFY